MLTQPLKGFRDFLPADAAARQWLKSQMVKVFTKWGYEPMETPTLEPLEIFSGQIGEDEKLFYKFKDNGDRDVALRYDQTVPTCRVIGQYQNGLTFPFRRYQIQSAFRAENTQKGRYREFTQADIDIFGITNPLADAEAIAVSLDLYRFLGFKQVVAVINNRKLMKDIPYEAIVSIDKLKKIGPDGVIQNMINKGITPTDANQYFGYVQNLKPDADLDLIFSYLEQSGFDKSWVRFDPTLARSFSYSDGPIWEIEIPEYSSGSVGGGERYDLLLEKFTGKNLGATGIAFGFDRTLEACQQFGLVPDYTYPTKILVTVFSPELFDKSLELSTKLRTSGEVVELYPDTRTKLEKQLKYASKKSIPFVAILGQEEIAAGQVKIKDMRTGTQKSFNIENLNIDVLIENIKL